MGSIQSFSSEDKQKLIDSIDKFDDEKVKQFIQLFSLIKQHEDAEATEIWLYPYYMDKTPVSNGEYKRFCDAVNHPVPEHWMENSLPDNAENLPVVNISLEDAKAYAKWAGKELPTEAEWEKACRGEKGNQYPWGDVWNPDFVKNKSGEIRQQFDKEYEQLNSEYHEKGGMFILKKHRFAIPPHPNTIFDEEELLNYVEGSLTLTLEEKQRVVDAITRLDQAQIDELLRLLHEEKQKFMELDEKPVPQLNALRKQYYTDLMQPFIADLYWKSSGIPGENFSPYNIANMVGHIFEMTISQKDNDFFIKGGSWFSNDPENACRAYSSETVKALEKRMDVGFRCVKPVFSKKDVPL